MIRLSEEEFKLIIKGLNEFVNNNEDTGAAVKLIKELEKMKNHGFELRLISTKK